MRLLIFILLFPLTIFSQILSDGSIIKISPSSKGYSFSGDLTSNFININTSITEVQTKASGKIEFWFKCDNLLTGSIESLFTVNDNNRTGFLFIQYQGSTDGKIRVIFYDGAFNTITTTASYNDNTWRKFSLISNGSAWNIQINDVDEAFSVTTGSNDGDWFDDVSITYMSIGATNYLAGTGQYTEAEIDRFMIYDTDNTTSLAAFPCSEGNESVAYDVSGNANHGSISGTDFYVRNDGNTYNKDYGNTYVVYNQVVIVPYKLDSTELYSSVSPIMNASEKSKEFISSYYDTDYILTNN